MIAEVIGETRCNDFSPLNPSPPEIIVDEQQSMANIYVVRIRTPH